MLLVFLGKYKIQIPHSVLLFIELGYVVGGTWFTVLIIWQSEFF